MSIHIPNAPFEKDNVIPDVLPPSTKLPYELVVSWPEETLDSPGKKLDREKTQPEPTVKIHPTPEESHNDYVLIMTDPDLMATNDQQFGQVRHWLATNVSISQDGTLKIPADVVSPYVGPAPLPNYISERPHRYVFILARPSGTTSITVKPEDLSSLQQKYAAAFQGRQDLQDLKDRWGFNAQEFLENLKLEPQAVTFMFVAGTLKSAADNIALTAQAAYNKVTGN